MNPLPLPAIDVLPATRERFADLRAVLEPKNNSSQACWCLTYRLTNAENRALVGERRAERLKQLCGEPYAPGVLAYVNRTPAGWCAVNPRDSFERLNRSKTIQKLDDTPVWSVVCLVVRAGYRRTGVARALIAGAVDYAASKGATTIEAYPIEADGERVSVSLAFTGTTKLFASAGFNFCAPTLARSAGKDRVIMRCRLNDGSSAA